jgi:hypothetical protein
MLRQALERLASEDAQEWDDDQAFLKSFGSRVLSHRLESEDPEARDRVQAVRQQLCGVAQPIDLGRKTNRKVFA